jgi:peptidylprolyl isomerase
MRPKRGVRAGWALLLALAVLCGAAVGAGCGGDDAPGGATTSGRDATTDQPPTEPGGPPPGKVAVEDMIEGSGPAAKVGDELTVNFIAVRYVDGDFFESSWDWPKPFTFELGMKDVIPGWVKGLPGMREGGRRHLAIPGKLAARGGASLLPEAEENSLVYVVDLIKVD